MIAAVTETRLQHYDTTRRPKPQASPVNTPCDQIQRHTYTVPEAAEVLGISRNSAYEAVRTGQIPSVRFGRRIVVPHKVIERLLSGEAAPAGPVGGQYHD